MITSDDLAICNEFRVTYRTFMTGGTIFAEIIDLDTGKSYIKASGDDHATAIAAAIAQVRTKPKPLTESQAKVAAMLSGASETIKASDDRAAELEAKLAEAKKLLEDTAKRAELAERKLNEVMSAEVPDPSATVMAATVSETPADPSTAPVRTRAPRTRAASADTNDSQ